MLLHCERSNPPSHAFAHPSGNALWNQRKPSPARGEHAFETTAYRPTARSAASPQAGRDGPSAPRSLDFVPQSAPSPPRRHSPKTLNPAAVPSGVKNIKCRLLYSSHPKRKPGPKGPSPKLIQAICELKRRNPRFGSRGSPSISPRRLAWRSTKTWSAVFWPAHYRPERRKSGPYVANVSRSREGQSLEPGPVPG